MGSCAGLRKVSCSGITHMVPCVNPLMPVGNYSYQFFICCPRDCVSRHNGGTSGAPLKPLRVDSALKALSTLRGLRGAPEVPPLCRETQSLGQQMLNATAGKKWVKEKKNRKNNSDQSPSCPRDWRLPGVPN